MTDISTWPGVAEAWPDFTPDPFASEGVVDAVIDYLTTAAPVGLRSVFKAKPEHWDDPSNFYGEGVPWGTSLYFYIPDPGQQIDTFTGDGRPFRIWRYQVSLICLFRSTLNDTEAASTLERRIIDGIRKTIRLDPSLGGTVRSAGLVTNDAHTDAPIKTDSASYEIWTEIVFEVDVEIQPGS